MDPHSLAIQARDSLRLPPPTISFDPAPYTVVNLATWLWLDPAIWQPFTATATAGSVTATASAAPQSVVWSMGDGHQVRCEGPGTAYRASVPSSAQSTDCSYTYTRSSLGEPSTDLDPNDGAFPVRATVLWDVTWRSVGAPGGGALAPLQTSASVPLRVEQVESVGTSG